MRKRYAIIFTAAFLLSLVFIFLDTGARKMEGDAGIYYRIAGNMAGGHGFSDRAARPYLPTMSREPVYPLFLALIFYLFGCNIPAVQLFQALIYALTCVVMFRVASILLDDGRQAFITSLSIALFPVIPSYTPYLFTEVLFTFLLALCVLSLMNSMRQDSLKWYFISGLLLGIASLCRAVLMFFIIFLSAALCVHFYRKYKRIITAGLLKAFALLLFGYALAAAPWMARNYLLFRRPSVTLRGFDSIYARAVKADLNADELRMYAVYCFSEFLAGKLYPGYNLTSTAGGYFYKPLLRKIKEYSNRGLSQEETDRMFKKEALALIRRSPVKFISMGFFELVKFNSFFQILLLNQKDARGVIPNEYILPAVKGFLKFFGFFIAIAAFLAMFSARRPGPEWMVPACVVIYFNIVHFFFDSVGRYAVPVIPCYIFFFTLQIRRWTTGRYDL